MVMKTTYPVITEPEEVMRLLRQDDRRQLYLGRDGRWHMSHHATFGAGISASAVHHLIEKSAVRRVYSDLDEAYWCGRTLDVEATLAARRSAGNRTAKVYVREECIDAALGEEK